MPSPNIARQAAPAFLSRVPKRVLAQLDPEQLVADFLEESAGEKPGIQVALGGLSTELRAAVVQEQRILRSLRQLPKQSRSRRTNIFSDIHFYAICWSRINKLSAFLARQLRFRRTGLVRRRYQQELFAMTDLRDHLEHYEERLVDGKRRRDLKQPHDLFNLIGFHATFGGARYDIGPTGLKTLRDFVKEFREALMFESLERLAQANQDRLRLRLQRAYRDVDIGRVIRSLGGRHLTTRC